MDKKYDLIPLKKEWIENAIFVFLCLFVFGIRLWNIDELNGPYVFDDEAGYWSHAANLAGLSWTEVVSLWYSYGYSILLMPLFWVTHNMSIVYKLAIGLNAALGVGSFLLGIGIIDELDIQMKRIEKYLICFAATCYSGYIIQSNVAWSETFIYFLFLLAIYLGIRFFGKKNIPSIVLFSASVMALYITHNRTVAVVIAFLIILAFMLVKRKISWKHLAVSIGVLVVFVLFDRWMKGYLATLMWNSKDGFHGNDIATEGNKLGLFLSVSGWKMLIKSFLGKIWYIFTSTLGFGALGIIYIVDKCISMIKNKEQNQEDKLDCFLFFLLSVLGVLALSVIVTAFDANDLWGFRLDVLIYGRYFEMLLYLLIVFGFVYLFGKKNRKIFLCGLFFCIILYGLSALALHLKIRGLESGYYLNNICVPGILFRNVFSYKRYSFIILGIMVIMFLSVWYGRINEKGKRLCGLGICLVMVVVFVRTGMNGYAITIEPHHKGHNSYAGSYDILYKSPEYPIYYQGTNFIARQGIRTRATESILHFCAPEENSENYFYVITKEEFDTLREQKAEYVFIGTIQGEYLLAKGQDILDRLSEEKVLYYALKEISSMSDEDFELSTDQDMEIILASEQDISLEVILSAEGKEFLMNDGNYTLSYHFYDTDGNVLVWDADRTILNIVGRESIKMTIPYNQVAELEEFYIEPDICDEGTKWMSQAGMETLRYHVIVQ